MNESISIALTVFGVTVVISFFVVLLIKIIYFSLKLFKKS